MSNIIRQWNGRVIRQRKDGYLSATDMCQACGKRFHNWERTDAAREYLQALWNKRYSDLSNGKVVDIVQGGTPEEQGTWIYRKAALRLAQWLSPDFAIQVDEWTDELLTEGKVEIVAKQPQLQPTIKDEIDTINACLSIAGLDPRLVAGVALNHAETRMPQLKGAIEEGHQLLAAAGQNDLLLTPTKIGKELGVSGRKVNEILIDLGYQVKNIGKTSKTEPDYLVTELGEPYAGNTMATGKLQDGKPDNTTYQHLKWKGEVIDIIRGQLAA